MNNSSYDFTPLTIKPGTGEVFRALLRSFKALPAGKKMMSVIVYGTVFAVLLAMPIGPRGELMTNLIFPISIFLGMMVSIFVLHLRKQRDLMVEAFALRNNLEFLGPAITEDRPGIIFNVGHSKSMAGGLRSHNSSFYEIGNYKFVTGSGKYSRNHDYGYICIKLPRKLPHILLDSKHNNFLGKLTNLPGFIERSQVLSLEGDFNNYYTLYVPEDYQRDALYILTPDIMRLFIEETGSYDVEIIDDNVYIYSDAPFNLLDPEALQKMFLIADKVRAEVLHQTDYYADERIGNREINIVADKGARLKGISGRKIALIGAIVFIIFLLIEFGTTIWLGYKSADRSSNLSPDASTSRILQTPATQAL